MEIDLELYRIDVRLPGPPPVRLSVIDINPDHPLRTLIFLHGFAGEACQWEYQLASFSDANRVIAPDLRGHGRSDKPAGPYTMDQVQADLEALFAALHVEEKFVLVGHSYGAAVAAEYAGRHPERVEALVLIAAAGEFKLNPLYRFLLRLPGSTLRLLAPVTRNWLGAPPHILKTWYLQNMTRWQGWERFASLPMPVQVIRGHRDRVFARPIFEAVAHAIPGSEEIDVGASGHMVMLERREAVNRFIQRLIERQGRTWREPEIPEPESQASLVRERPWLSQYDEGVPATIAVPSVPLHHLLLSAVRRFPRKTALNYEGYRMSYRRLDEESNRFANLLRSLGVQKGTRVIIILPNLPQLVIAFYGALKAGAVAVFGLPATNPQELVREIRDSGAVVLVTLTKFDELIYQIKNQLEPGGNSPLRHVIFTHVADYLPPIKRLAVELSPTLRKRHQLDIPLDASMHVFSRVLYAHEKKAPGVEIAPSDPAVIQYTGGTQDQPKGVLLSHRNLVANALQTRHWMVNAREGVERVLCVVPVAHNYGLTAALNVPIALGGTLILKYRFQVEDVLKTIRATRPTLFPGVPQMFVAIKDFPGVRRYGVDSIKACICGSTPLPVEVLEAFEKLTHGRLIEGYGLTEASPITHATPMVGRRKLGSIGLPLPSTEARILALEAPDQPVPPGQIGELAVRGPQVMLGYWNDPEATKKVVTPDGWLLTGDVAQMDEEGYFRILARKGELWYLDQTGAPASPRDIEEVLAELPQVKEVAVVSVDGAPVAYVIPEEGEHPNPESLVAYCRRRLPPELVPERVVFVDQFPRSFIGKVLRRELVRQDPQNPPSAPASQDSEKGV